MKRNSRPFGTLFLIVVITVLAILIDIPKGPSLNIGPFHKDFTVHRGLDLQGGTHLLYEADLSKIAKDEQGKAMESAMDIMRRRVDGLGVSEPNLQTTKIGDKQGIIIELPGIQNVDEAVNLIGKTAELQFFTEDGKEVVTGKDLKRATVDFQGTKSQNQGVVVSLEFNDRGRDKFAEATKNNVGKRILIVLDNEIVQAPVVQTEITDGKAIITGYESMDAARKVALELNTGALPVPLKLAEQRNIGATLGDLPIKQSLVAGLIGLLAVAIFMIVIYKVPGFLATLALGIYSLIVLALFKYIPVTLTLAGIAGFILSIGVAVDANILIFERFKEELRKGKALNVALEDGFRRAWDSIRDSNISSVLTSLILIWFGSGLIRGFALTLAIGILVSLFTAITVSRTFLYFLVSSSKFSKYARI